MSPPPTATVSVTPDAADPSQATVTASFSQSGAYTITVKASVSIGNSSGTPWLGSGTADLSAIANSSSVTYDPGPPPMVGPIQIECVEDELPKDRTTIGIGEQVKLSIDPSTWYDTDYEIDSYGNQTPISDGMGTITWWTEGSGSVYPTTGNSTMLTADLAAGDTSVTVHADVADSGLLGLDNPLNVLVQIWILIPNGFQANKATDTPGTWKQQPPANNIGARTIFQGQIMPTLVSFRWVEFRENIPAQNQGNWPDGTPQNRAADIVPFNVPIPGVPGVNSTDDQITGGLFPIGRLNGWHFEFTTIVPLEYQDAGGTWRLFFTEKHMRNFGLGVPSQFPPFVTYVPVGRVGVEALNTLWGGWMGPWQ